MDERSGGEAVPTRRLVMEVYLVRDQRARSKSVSNGNVSWTVVGLNGDRGRSVANNAEPEYAAGRDHAVIRNPKMAANSARGKTWS